MLDYARVINHDTRKEKLLINRVGDIDITDTKALSKLDLTKNTLIIKCHDVDTGEDSVLRLNLIDGTITADKSSAPK